MTTDLYGMGGCPGWLSDARRHAILAEEAQERADRREQYAERAHALSAELARQRGEVVDQLAVSMGFGGRSIEEVLEHARAQADREDALADARARRESHPVPVLVAEPVIVEAVTPEKRKLLNRSRRFRD